MSIEEIDVRAGDLVWREAQWVCRIPCCECQNCGLPLIRQVIEGDVPHDCIGEEQWRWVFTKMVKAEGGAAERMQGLTEETGLQCKKHLQVGATCLLMPHGMLLQSLRQLHGAGATASISSTIRSPVFG